MYKLLLATAIITLTWSCARETLSEQESETITSALMATRDSWNEGDIDGFMKGYLKSKDLAFVGSAGPTYGYNATMDRYKTGYPDTVTMGKLDFKVLNLRKIDRHTALMIGMFQLTRTIGDAEGYFTLVWQKKGDNWVIISDHTSSSAN